MKKHMEIVYAENELLEIKFLIDQEKGNVKTFFIPGKEMSEDARTTLQPMFYDFMLKGNDETEVKVLEVVSDELGTRAAKAYYDGALSVITEIEENDVSGIEIQLDKSNRSGWKKFFENMEREITKTPAKNIVSRKEWD